MTKPNKRSNYIAAVIVNAILVVVVNKIPGWNIGFITGGFTAVLWALNLSFGVQIAGNAVLVAYHPLPLHYAVNVVFNAVGALSTYLVYREFPFDFSETSVPWFDTVARVVLIVGFAGSILGAVVHLIKAFTHLRKAAE